MEAIDHSEDRSVSMGRANVWAILALGPLVVAITTAFVLLHGWDPIVRAGDTSAFVMLGALIGGIVLHEGLHALAWKIAGAMPWSDVRLGFQLKTLTPYAHSRVPMSARAYRIGAATPGLVLGLAPAAASLATGSGFWLLFGVLFTIAAGGDALILWLLRGIPPGRLVQDHPSRAGCLVLGEGDDE